MAARHGAKSSQLGSKTFETILSKFESFSSTTFSLAITPRIARHTKSQIWQGNLPNRTSCQRIFLRPELWNIDLDTNSNKRGGGGKDAYHQTDSTSRTGATVMGLGTMRRTRPPLQMHRSLGKPGLGPEASAEPSPSPSYSPPKAKTRIARDGWYFGTDSTYPAASNEQRHSDLGTPRGTPPRKAASEQQALRKVV